jgi:8-oxo-dGTP diphosphatase
MTGFVVRVYGIYVSEQSEILLTDEFIKGKYITKFPGGGLDYGEGTRECLAREMLEETGQEFVVLDHFYTTDFFVESAFDKDKQVISIYYLIKPENDLKFLLKKQKFDFAELKEGAQTFRMLPLSQLNEDELTLVIDKRVVNMINSTQSSQSFHKGSQR